MAELQKIRITCPSCNHEFSTYSCSQRPTEAFEALRPAGQGEANIAEPTKMDHISTEFRRYRDGVKPLHFEMHTCPFCGLTGNIARFVDRSVPPVNDGLRAFLAEHILPVVRNDHSWMSFSGERFELLARIMEYEGVEPQMIGLQYLKAAWCAKDLFHKKEPQFRMRVVEFFQKALETASGESPALSPMRKAVMKYMIAEQYRRVGNCAAATEWYEQVQNGVSADALLAELAEQQKSNPQEFLTDKQHMAFMELAKLV